MKTKITFLIIAVITLALAYFILRQYKELKTDIPNSPSLTNKDTQHSYPTQKTNHQPVVSTQQPSGSTTNLQYKQLITQFKQRLGPLVTVSIKQISTGKNVLIQKKKMLVDEVIITTHSERYGTNSFQAFIDPKTQVILKQWNFKRKDGLFIKYNRPKPLHPSGQIKR